MKRFAIACAAVIGMIFVGSASAEAGGWGRGWYGGHRHYGHYHSPRVWHDTSHFDYHPGGYVRHYNHYHYVPGHYHYHGTGHWDTFHGNHVHHHGW